MSEATHHFDEYIMVELRPFRGRISYTSYTDTKQAQKPREITDAERNRFFEQQRGFIPILTLILSIIGIVVTWIALFVFSVDLISKFYVVLVLGQVVFPIGLLIISLISVAVGTIIMKIGRNVWYKRYGQIEERIGPPRLLVSSAAIQRGDRLKVLYRQGIASRLHLKEFKFQLLLQETMSYKVREEYSGDTYTHIIDTIIFPEETLEAGIMLEKVAVFLIPENAMHTLDIPNYSLTWFLQVDLEGQNLISSERYKLTLPVDREST